MCYTSAQRATEAARSILDQRRNWAMMPVEQTARLREIERKYEEMFGGSAEIVVRAPGRINLIGEHTDYNDGFVFPAAIDRGLYIAASPSETGSELVSIELGDGEPFDAPSVEPPPSESWSKYAAGMAFVLRQGSILGYGGDHQTPV